MRAKERESERDIREERIQNSLSSEQRVVAGKLVGHRTLVTHRPRVHHLVLLLLSLELELEHVVLDGVVAGLGEPRDGTHALGRHHDLVVDQRALLHVSDDVSARNMVADLRE